MKKTISFLIAGLFILASCNRPNLHVKLSNDTDSISYLIGISVGKSLKQSDVDKVNAVAFARGISEVYGKDSLKITDEQLQMKIQAYFMKLQQKNSEKATKENAEFFAKNKSVAGVVTLPSGLQYQVIKEGTGPKPDSSSVVKVHYTGTLINGTEFDSSVKRGTPATFPVTGVIPGWTEALLKMNVGSKWKVFIPSQLGYGERPPRGSNIKPNSVLIFEVELLSIEPKQAAEAAPTANAPKAKKK
jgi:FKBP-type peptidyl-prolyl cis-trans isomerase FklB